MPKPPQVRPVANDTLTRLDDGRVIVGTQPAMGEHPNPKLKGRVIEFANILEILVDDGTADGVTMWTCIRVDEEQFCGKTWNTLLSAMSHAASHGRVSFTRYEPRVLNVIARVVHEAKHDGNGRNYMERAADVLNERGLTTVNGLLWTASLVSHVWNEHCRNIRVPKRRVGASMLPPPITTLQPAPAPLAPTTDEPETLATWTPVKRYVASMAHLDRAIKDAANAFAALSGLIEQLGKLDPEMIEKARKYDALRESLK